MSAYTKVNSIPSLVEAIREFSNQGRPEHQACMDRLRNVIHIDPSFKDLLPDFYHWYYEKSMHDENPHIVKSLRGMYDEKYLRQFSLSMKWCRCCSRHSHYKNVPFKPADPLPESKRTEACPCTCRRMLRLFTANGLA
uniref:Uncharacterized protein n=1 Tax=viral metagenome TaxID=1070528 RepID=A0A6C0AHG7_9ZZZZ